MTSLFSFRYQFCIVKKCSMLFEKYVVTSSLSDYVAWALYFLAEKSPRSYFLPLCYYGLYLSGFFAHLSFLIWQNFELFVLKPVRFSYFYSCVVNCRVLPMLYIFSLRWWCKFSVLKFSLIAQTCFEKRARHSFLMGTRIPHTRRFLITHPNVIFLVLFIANKHENIKYCI